MPHESRKDRRRDLPKDRPKDREVVPFEVGDTVVLRKPHPCGSSEWKVYRIGADIGLLCSGCRRRVMLERPIVQRRMKSRTPVKS
ncbi:MAG: DUF951 domain-containing protein [Chloroflexi bacterium]|nr:DUF951 domain-containing protein [Chloroflexota bacterium]MYF78388.1 DUF951 domain-containing protein [Chloroflexota bacterium]MYK60550.1 DUF951 domain-containing protein [Chloroflexota bacterium]